MDRPAQPDRYEPLPPLLQIPGFLVRKLSHRQRQLALAALALFVVALAIAIPSLIAAKHRSDAADARAAARAQVARIAALRKEIRRIDGTGPAAHGLTGAKALTARKALAADLAAAITADAARRARTGEFANVAKSVQCSRFPPVAGTDDPATHLGLANGRYACLAITADFSRATNTVGGSIGYPYRALVHFKTGRFAFCKISGRPGELVITRTIPVPVPPACGGED